MFRVLSIFLIIGLCSAAVFAQGAKGQNYKARVVWQEVAGAGGYSVEIKNQKGITVFTIETDRAEVFPRLPQGDYQMKITVLDKFKREANSTPWTKITVHKYETPMFERVEPADFIVSAGDSKKEIVIKGDNFEPNIILKIDGPSNVKIISMKRVSEEELRAEIDITDAKEGKYAIILENTAEKRNVASNVLSMRLPAVSKPAEIKAVISSVSPSRLVIPSKSEKFTVKGKGFSRDMKISVLQDGKEYPVEQKFINEEEISVVLSPEGMDIGKCGFVLKQGGLALPLYNVNVSRRLDGLLGLGGIYFGVGYNFNKPLADWDEYYNSSKAGWNIYASKSLFSIHSYKGITLFGLESDFSAASFKRKSQADRWDSVLKTYHEKIKFSISNDSRMPLSIIIRGGGGVVYSVLAQDSDSGSKNVTSVDFSVSAGTALRFNIKGVSFIETGVDMEAIFYKGQSYKGINAFARVGVIL